MTDEEYSQRLGQDVIDHFSGVGWGCLGMVMILGGIAAYIGLFLLLMRFTHPLVAVVVGWAILIWVWRRSTRR